MLNDTESDDALPDLLDPQRRITFVADALVEEIIAGKKTASVSKLDEVDRQHDEFDGPLVVGQLYDVYDLKHHPRCRIRITSMEMCRWPDVPERLWHGEVCRDAEHFRQCHLDYFDNPGDGFEYLAYYFHLVDVFQRVDSGSEAM